MDGAGNVGPMTIARLELAPDHPPPSLSAPPTPPSTPPAANPDVAGVEVFVVDPLDKVHPLSGEMIPARGPRYRLRRR